MSPEQVRGREVGPRSDLFALGSLLYEMVTGVAPFRGDSAAEILHRICTWDPPPVRSLNPAVPDALSAFIGRLLEKDLRKRPPDAEAALAVLDEILTSLPTEETTVYGGYPGNVFRPSVDTPTVLSRDRRGWRVAAGVAALAVLAAVGIWLQDPPRTLYVAVPETVTAAPGSDGKDIDLAASAVRTALLQGLLGFEHIAPLEPSRGDAAADQPIALARALA